MFVRSHLLLLLVAVLLLVSACSRGEAEPSPPELSIEQTVVNQAIAAHGGDALKRTVVEFDFRDKHFKVTRDGGIFEYERTYTDSTGNVREILNNDGIFRDVNGQRVQLTEKDIARLATPLNSVPYFALLPFNLSDPAVQLSYLGESTLEGSPYHKIQVTFQQEGGGRDYEDRFIYWFHTEDLTMDYLAYGFHTDDGGTRFRKAVNVRTIGGVRIADYLNYISDELPLPTSPIEQYDSLFDAGYVELLSEINLDHVTITPLPSK